MSAIKDNAKVIDQLGSFLKPLIELGPELKRIGSLEDYEKRLNKSIDDLKKDQSRIGNEIKLACQELNNDRDNFKDEVKSSKNELDAYKKAAETFNNAKRKEADELIASAKREATSITDLARSDGNKIKEDALNSILDQQKEIDAKKEIIKSLDADIATRNKALADINKKLDALRN